jgi:hypothetical protein
MVEGRKKATQLDLSFNLIELTSGLPAGYTMHFDAVAGALSETSVPANAATGVLTTAAPTFTFNKPMPIHALLAQHWTFTKVSDGAAVAFTAGFGSTSVDGVSVPDPTKIVLTPDAALTAAAQYRITLAQQIPSVDGTQLDAAVTVTFTCA